MQLVPLCCLSLTFTSDTLAIPVGPELKYVLYLSTPLPSTPHSFVQPTSLTQITKIASLLNLLLFYSSPVCFPQNSQAI